MVDISKTFTQASEPISAVFDRPGLGFYIPLYQREYSWSGDNIDQLMEDLCAGVRAIISDENFIRFMGTLIVLNEDNVEKNIKPQDAKALPTKILNVIDGQQRISTIAMLGCLLYEKFLEFKNKINKQDELKELNDLIDGRLDSLVELFSIEMKRGVPTKKPIIIRGSVDGWTYEGEDVENYVSPVSNYLATFIRSAFESDGKFIPPKAIKGSLVEKNIRGIRRWLQSVDTSHVSSTGVYPSAWDILEGVSQKNVWTYERQHLLEMVMKAKENESLRDDKALAMLCSIVQMSTLCHFLLDRCCFTTIKPSNENWAFDMFQSLNASGTPLTAIETFKPLVVNVETTSTSDYKGSDAEKHFGKVDSLFDTTNTAQQKNKLTNEFLTTFAICNSGETLSSHFSKQRIWLNNAFTEGTGPDLVQRMGDLASYWLDVIRFDPERLHHIPGVSSEDDFEAKLCATSILYLNDAGHRMANTVLGRFYSNVVRSKEGASSEFISVSKAVASFFTLWRASASNAGLDDVYRELFRSSSSPCISWNHGDKNLKADSVKKHLKAALKRKGVLDKVEWLKKCDNYLRYDSAKNVCKFVLMVTSHDTIPDIKNPGIMKSGTKGTRDYLNPQAWKSKDYSTIEHVAPRNPKPTDGWDSAIYEQDDHHKVGNLTLLPTDINSSAGAKSWAAKLIYYKHLAESDPDMLEQLQLDAEEQGVELPEKTIELLRNTKHKDHIRPIVQMLDGAEWDKELIDKRSRRMYEITWDRLRPWLD